jgi:hypothetical protein
MKTRLSFDMFFTGLLAGIASRGRRAISIRTENFDQLVASVVEDLRRRYPEDELDLRFFVLPHYLHGYSETVRDGIAAATQADLVSLDNPEFQDLRFKIDASEAQDILQRLPLPPDVFLSLADEFLKNYDEGIVPATSGETLAHS